MVKSKLPDFSNIKEPKVITWKGEDEEQKIMTLYNAAIDEVKPVIKSLSTTVYRDAYSPSISIRDEFDRADYDLYRPGEAIPTDDKGMIQASMRAYKKSGNGIIKNIVDLMTDFTIQGIDVAHPNKKIEKVLKFWFNKIVKGKDRSEQFVSLMCRASNVIIKRDTAKLPLTVVRKMYKTTSSPNTEYVDEETTVENREFPIAYTFLHPLSIQVDNPELSMFAGNKKKSFSLIIPPKLSQSILHPVTTEQYRLVDLIPGKIVDSIRAGTKVIPLDKDKVEAYYYKKDDWEVWAQPMIYTVLSDLKHLEKLKLADLSALDGVISQIRIWKIGDIAKGIKPNAQAMQKLATTLMNSVSGGIVDLMWTEDLQFQEVSSNLHNFLGETKYIPILNAIYTGLGIPPLFTGSSNQGSFTNNFLAIKTMIERLESLRNLLREFWNREFEIVAKALKLDKMPTLTFDRMTLNDESSVLQLLLHLVDRGYLSIETVQEMVGANPEVEEFRIRREWKEQKNGKRPPKASPFHKAEWQETWIDSFVKLGELTPSEVGIELQPRKNGEESPVEKKLSVESQLPDKLPNDMGGRPNGKKDSVKRKQKEVKPRRSVQSLIKLMSWATDTQNKVSETVTPIYLGMQKKKNLRQLTDNEIVELEKLKLAIFASIPPYEHVSESSITSILTDKDIIIPETVSVLVKGLILDYKTNVNEEITIDKVREMQAIAYSVYNLDEAED